MRVFSIKEAAAYTEYMQNAGLPGIRHQISHSFSDGMYGQALVNGTSSAVVVFDFVECSGPFDEQIYSRILEIKEAHLLDPPDDWKQEIRRCFTGKYREYTRTAFFPLPPDSQTDCKPANGDDYLPVDGGQVVTRAIDRGLVQRCMQEQWSSDAVKNTMLPECEGPKGFGFAACLGKKIVGAIGCYTLYTDGVEIEIDTHADFRRKGIAFRLAKTMRAECANRNLVCHWDAMNPESAALARKLGFRAAGEYTCLELTRDRKERK
ncbi:MAG: GNAT family N-acetyltransferase [Spirochaetales bacterium]|nr:GNAT family N-acetyltransferase [Spirochaetales bacterium]